MTRNAGIKGVVISGGDKPGKSVGDGGYDRGYGRGRGRDRVGTG